MKKLALLFVSMMLSLLGVSQNHWNPNIHQFPTNMNVIAILEINGIEQQSDALEIGVFCGDECRGSNTLAYYDAPIDRYMFFLTIYGNNGDPFTFRLYDHITEQELDLVSQNSMQYLSNDIQGSLFNPYVFSFTGGECQVYFVVEPEAAGQLIGPAVSPSGTYCTVIAEPFLGSSFVEWSCNGKTLSTELEYSFNLVADITLTGTFQYDNYTVTLSAEPEEGGTVEGEGEFYFGTMCEVKAFPNEGFEFVGWTENGELVSQDSSYWFEIYSDRVLVAHFAVVENPENYEIVAEVKPSEGGTVHGAGTFEAGSVCSLSVELNEHYEFVNWTENGVEVSTNPNYSFVVSQDRFLEANVTYINGVDEVGMAFVIYPNPTTGTLQIKADEPIFNENAMVRVVDMNGKVLLETTKDRLDLSSLDDGVYFISVGGGKLQKVVLRR